MKKAVSVERLLQWAYGTELVRGMPAWGDTPGGGSSGAPGRGCHDDALTVDQVVSQLSDEGALLLRSHALMGNRPDVKRRRFVPVYVHKSGIAECWEAHVADCGCRGHADICKRPQDDTRRRHSDFPFYPPGWGPPSAGGRVNYVPVRCVDAGPSHVTYVTWWAALKVIRDVFAAAPARLLAHSVTDALPPAAPWQTKISVDGRLLHV